MLGVCLPCPCARPARLQEELLAECGLLAGRGKIPCYRCYVAGEEVEVGPPQLHQRPLPAQPHPCCWILLRRCSSCCCLSAPPPLRYSLLPAQLSGLAAPRPTHLLQSYAGGTPAEVAKMVARQLAQLKGSGGGLLAKLLLAAGAAAAAAAAAYWHLGRRQGGGGGGGDAGGLAAEMRSLSERIGIAQQRLRCGVCVLCVGR